MIGGSGGRNGGGGGGGRGGGDTVFAILPAFKISLFAAVPVVDAMPTKVMNAHSSARLKC